jgi:hypothetical protein
MKVILTASPTFTVMRDGSNAKWFATIVNSDMPCCAAAVLAIHSATAIPNAAISCHV